MFEAAYKQCLHCRVCPPESTDKIIFTLENVKHYISCCYSLIFKSKGILIRNVCLCKNTFDFSNAQILILAAEMKTVKL